MTTDALRNPSHRLPLMTPLMLILELIVVLIIAFSATVQFLDSNPYTQLPGGETEWLTNSAYLASSALHEYGYIPRWQPWLGFGEPLIDNPFSFVMNPVSIYPSLFNGGVVGIKVSVALTAILAGLGGWVLGRVLGFGSLARLLLAVLCIGKGNMYALIGTGYFQLGTSQAYMPWVIAGTLGILRFRQARWPVILTVVMFTLMFWAGNIWYTLPMLVSMTLLVAFHILRVRQPEVDQGGALRFRIIVDYALFRRVIFAACLTVALSAITFVPIFLNQGYIGGHPRDLAPAPTVDLGAVIVNYFDGDLEHFNERMGAFSVTHHYSFVLPFWLGVLIFVLLPPIKPLHHPGQPRGWQVWLAGLLMIVGCTLWGKGGDPLFTWLYQVIPFLGNWRFVGRALAVASFWIAVLAALRMDGLWRAVFLDDQWLKTLLLARIVRLNKYLGSILRIAAAVLLISATAVTASQLTSMWHVLAAPSDTRVIDDVCISWLRAQNPGRELAVWGTDYRAITTYQKNKVRHQDIEADFKPQPIPSTLFNGNLTVILPEYGIAWDNGTRQYFLEQGYLPMPDSPKPVDEYNCLYQKQSGILPYAFAVAQPTLDRYSNNMLPESAITPLTQFARYPDQIGLIVDADPLTPLAVSVQELAYPGWSVTVNGAPAQLESLGGFIAVVLQPGSGTNYLDFKFQPPLLMFGGVLTLFAWVICVAYLLRLERFLPKRIRTSPRLFTRAAAALWAFLLDPRALEKKDELEAEASPPDIPTPPGDEQPQ